MRAGVLLFVTLLITAGCGESPPGEPGDGPAGSAATAPDQSTPKATVEAWIAAAKAGDRERALSLGTDEWRQKETTWDRSFTTAVFDKGYQLLRCEIRDPEIEGDEARVSCRAVFLVEGEEDNEGLRFRLVKIDGKWRIAELG